MSMTTNVAIDQDTYERLQKFCKESGLSQVNAVKLALDDWLEQVGPSVLQVTQHRHERLVSKIIPIDINRLPKTKPKKDGPNDAA